MVVSFSSESVFLLIEAYSSFLSDGRWEEGGEEEGEEEKRGVEAESGEAVDVMTERRETVDEDGVEVADESVAFAFASL